MIFAWVKNRCSKVYYHNQLYTCAYSLPFGYGLHSPDHAGVEVRGLMSASDRLEPIRAGGAVILNVGFVDKLKSILDDPQSSR